MSRGIGILADGEMGWEAHATKRNRRTRDAYPAI